eukprot:6516754-Prymnesium_polylepis.1
MRSGKYLGVSQRAVRSDMEQATCDARHKTDAGAASFIPLSRPDMCGRRSQTHPTYPTPQG